MAKKRVREISHQISTLKNLTNSQYYASSDSDWQKIQRKLIDAVYDLDRHVRLNDKNEINDTSSSIKDDWSISFDDKKSSEILRRR